jgi:hypothetical protein
MSVPVAKGGRMTRLDDPEGGSLVQARSVRRLLVALSLVTMMVVAGIGVAPQSGAASRWAAAPVATIHPGVMTDTPIGQCTANFVYFQGDEVYLGQAAHCSGTGAETDTDGCSTGSLPLGTPVQIEGATHPGRIVYSSWLAMHAAHEKDPATCAFNDFALVRIDPVDRPRVNPTVPFWGGPTGISRTGTKPFDVVYSFGNSSLRQGIELLQPKTGISFGDDYGGWTHLAYQLLPGIPGDSGSPLLDSHGRAVGILSTLDIFPSPGGNSFADAERTLQYARAHGFPHLLLARGTKPFNPSQLPLG